MLVLTRKTNEQILIGDDIKVTIVRVRGNSVRIGIEAPRSVRVVRGELEMIEREPVQHERDAVPQETFQQDIEVEVDDLAQLFAHPESVRLGSRRPKNHSSKDRASKKPISDSRIDEISVDEVTDKAQVFVGKVSRDGSGASLARVATPKTSRAPLAGFVSSN